MGDVMIKDDVDIISIYSDSAEISNALNCMTEGALSDDAYWLTEAAAHIESLYENACYAQRTIKRLREEIESLKRLSPKTLSGDFNLDQSIKSCEELTVRTRNCILAERINTTVRDLTEMTEVDILKMTAMGKKSLNEIKLFLANKGLSLKVHTA